MLGLAVWHRSWADSGGHASTARRPVTGRDRVARYLVGGWRKVPGDLTFTLTKVNGDTALLVTTGGRPLAIVALEFEDTLVAGIRIIANPEKLSHLAALPSSQGV